MTSNGFTVSAIDTNEPSPARGLYFQDISHAMDVTLVRLSINFTLSGWIFNFVADRGHLFMKNDMQDPNFAYFNVLINSEGKL